LTAEQRINVIFIFNRAGEVTEAELEKVNDILARPTGKSQTTLHIKTITLHPSHILTNYLADYRLQHPQVVPQQTKRHQRRNLVPTYLQCPRHQAQRGSRETEEDQSSQRSQTFLGS
jgi:hypothetical protein